MSEIKDNPIMIGASGMLAKVVVYRKLKDGRVIMAKKPSKRDVLTDHQVVTKSKFLRASRYAKAQLADPIARAEYQAGVTAKKTTAYVVAMTDFLTPPEIHEIDTSRYTGGIGETIVIRASDDFKLISLQIFVYDAAGALLESGDGILQPLTDDDWRYVTTVANPVLGASKVTVIARDRAGNVTTLDKVL